MWRKPSTIVRTMYRSYRTSPTISLRYPRRTLAPSDPTAGRQLLVMMMMNAGWLWHRWLRTTVPTVSRDTSGRGAGTPAVHSSLSRLGPSRTDARFSGHTGASNGDFTAVVAWFWPLWEVMRGYFAVIDVVVFVLGWNTWKLNFP